MKTVRLFVIASAIGLSLTPLPALAHHSLAGTYDMTTVVTIKGTVTQVRWMNPHAWITLAVRNSDGTTSETRVEIGGPAGLINRGFTVDLLKIGDAVTFEAWMPKTPGSAPPGGRTLVLPDGRRFDVSDNFGAKVDATAPR